MKYSVKCLQFTYDLDWSFDVANLVFFFFLSFFGLFRASPMAYGGSQASGWIKAVAANLYHSHSNLGSELPLWPTPQLMASLDP